MVRLIALGAALALQPAAMASNVPAYPTASPVSTSVDEIVVTARRTGIPVWRVDGPGSSLIVVGTIADVAPGTQWDRSSLRAALRRADQVMFPASVQFSASPFQMLGWAQEARRMATLPKGRTLSEYVTAVDYQRLANLEKRGVLSPGIDRRHPLQLITELVNYAKGESPARGFFSVSRVRSETDPDAFVRSAVKKFKISLVPLPKAKLSPVITGLFNAAPHQNARCMRAAITLAEFGPRAHVQRSADWSQRRVRDVLNSPAQRALEQCRPTVSSERLTPELRSTIRSLLADRRTTLAVIDLPLLAQPGGLLDELAAANFKISGPTWK